MEGRGVRKLERRSARRVRPTWLDPIRTPQATPLATKTGPEALSGFHQGRRPPGREVGYEDNPSGSVGRAYINTLPLHISPLPLLSLYHLARVASSALARAPWASLAPRRRTRQLRLHFLIIRGMDFYVINLFL